MAILEVTIPQMGEGLQEARLLRFLKEPGDAIARDEPIFEMETDKATMEIEAPVAGVLVEWLVAPDAVVPIGAVVGRIEANVPAQEQPVSPRRQPAPPADAEPAAPDSKRATRNALVPPRTRAYARECGMAEADLMALADKLGTRVMPADVDRFLSNRVLTAPVPMPAEANGETVALSAAQRTLVYRMQQRYAEAIPATEEVVVPWEPIDRLRSDLKARARQGGDPPPTPFLILAWCVVRAVARAPVFRCTYAGDGMLRRYDHLHLGLAVTRGDDELITARVASADALGFWEFARAAVGAVKRARCGEDQASGVMQLTLSNLVGLDILRAIPVVVPPAVGTLFVGAVHLVPQLTDDGVAFVRAANVSLTFDHRVVNGVGAARFLAGIRAEVAALTCDRLVPSE